MTEADIVEPVALAIEEADSVTSSYGDVTACQG